MKSTHKNSTVGLVGVVAVTALKPCLAPEWTADQFTSPFIGMDQVTRNGP
jgi:hypothetical protein